MFDIKRREFITLLSSAVTGWPFGARAEQPPRKRPLLGYLITGTKDGLTHSVSAFLSRLRDLGYVEGQNIDIVTRYAEADRSEEHTSELQSLTNLVCRLLLEKKN